MLLRMYTRWADKQGFTTSVLSRAEGTSCSPTAAIQARVVKLRNSIVSKAWQAQFLYILQAGLWQQ